MTVRDVAPEIAMSLEQLQDSRFSSDQIDTSIASLGLNPAYCNYYDRSSNAICNKVKFSCVQHYDFYAKKGREKKDSVCVWYVRLFIVY